MITDPAADPNGGTLTRAEPDGNGGRLPLEGIRIVDVGTFIAGPYAAALLGEFGAEVLKVEHPVAGDPFRRFGTPTSRSDSTLAWLSEARNKKSVTIDLRVPKGAELFRRLIAKSDVLIENFRPGRMAEWGLGWDVLREVNPGLVMLQVSGYGQTGPYRDRPGFAHIAHAFGGLSYLAGFPGQTPVVPGSTPLGDYMSSLYGAIGIMLALRQRRETGKGQVIDVGIYEAVFRQLDEIAAAYALYGKVREREGSGTVIACPHGHFRTKDDKWVAIACTNDKMFARLAEDAMDRPELASSSAYGLQAKRLAARKDVDRIVSDWTASMTREELMAKCLKADVPIGSLNNIADIFADEHFRARQVLETVHEPGIGDVVVPRCLPRLSETPGRIRNLGPPLGNATDEVLETLLGFAAHEIRELHEARVV
ncbi:MAG: CoA transferase [Alphaproteobacteria bacterium]|jgi:succinyl-CoA:(S)-malate CoA-transferase subunit A|nr:CoA transferase [Alphaproteobacteria bacterium]